MTRALRRIMIAAAVAGIAACSKSPTGPVAGTLKVKLTTPNSGSDGAVLLTVSGPVQPSAAAAGAGSLRLFGAPASTTNTYAITTTGSLTNGEVLMTFDVDDVNKVSQYAASLSQVAALSTFQLRSLSGYSLQVTK